MTTLQNKIILVTGATGKQGDATARNLVKAGVKVRALTRKPETNKAKELRTMGNFWEFGTGKKEVIG